MNEYRQTKEYYVPKERVKRNVPRYPKSYGHDQIIEQNKDVDNIPEEIKEIKKRTMNELRQTKEYYVAKQKVLSDVGFDTNEEMKQIASCVKEIAKIDPVKQIMAQQIDEDLIEDAKDTITEKIIKQIDDIIFEMVCEEMSKNYLFQWQNYLTGAGLDMFEDEWFELYHEHHGDILYRIRQAVYQ